MAAETQPRRAAGPQPAEFLRRMAWYAGRIPAYLRAWRDVARERRHLEALDDRFLADIGVDRIEARREAMRSFWDLPREYRPRGR